MKFSYIFLVFVCLITFSSACKSKQFRIFTFCTITIHHIGSLPSVEEIKSLSTEERLDAMRPLLCQCSEGKIGSLCTKQVWKFLKPFRHPKLCYNYSPLIHA